MKALARYLRRHPLGVAGPLLLIGSEIARDLNLSEFLGSALFVVGLLTIFVHFFSAVGPWFSKRISYGEALANALAPVMLVWVIAVLARACVLGLLGKSL
jgi:hypothetical protein